jgi:phage shock protein PspC (stress-responsive transcriptional regulator)
MIAGVCGGLAEYFGFDATLIRVAAVILGLIGGWGILAYVVCWIVVPQKPIEESIPDTQAQTADADADKSTPKEKGSGVLLAGVFLIILGLLILLNNFIPVYWLSIHKLWPIALIILGIMIISRGSWKKEDED